MENRIENNEVLTKSINFLRFFLMILVVMIHSRFVTVNGINIIGENTYPLYTNISYFISEILSRIAVPLFFVISGFLFFYKVNDFTFSIYKNKLKKRVKTLLVPYIIWNLVFIAFLFFIQYFSFSKNASKLIVDYSFSDWIFAFWDINVIQGVEHGVRVGDPICRQFWFIRDLMVAVLFSPLIYFLLKKLKYFIVLILGFLWVFDYWFYVTGFYVTSFFFFSLGAYFSIYKKDVIKISSKLLLPSIIAYFVCSSILLYTKETGILFNINILIGIIWMAGITFNIYSKRDIRIKHEIISSNFFIYAYHMIPIAVIFSIIKPVNTVTALLYYFLIPTAVIIVGILLYYLLHRYLPRFTAVLTGGR